MAETQVAVVMSCLAALTWLQKVESPSLRVHCDPAEFPYSGICCKLCPAGTYVGEFCTVPRTQGICEVCIAGETYTDHENGLAHCFPCSVCKSGFKMIAPCTSKKNTECQCNDGYFCPQGCEECMKCKTQCPEGQVVMKSCNATTDMKCGSPFPETSDSSFPSIYIGIGVSIGVVFLAIVIIGCLVYCLYKRRKSKGMKESRDNLISDNENKNSKTEASAPPQDRLPETAEGEDLEMREQDSFLPNRPSVSSSLEAACSNGQSSGGNNVQSSNNPAVRFNTSCKEKLEKTYFQTRNIVLPDDWQRLMRKCGLSDVDLENIKHDNPQHSDERHYQMLRTLRDRNGVVPAFNKILDSLKEMHLNDYAKTGQRRVFSEKGLLMHQFSAFSLG